MVSQLVRSCRDLRKVMIPDPSDQMATFIQQFKSNHCVKQVPEILLQSNEKFVDFIVQGLVFSSFHAWLRFHKIPADDSEQSAKHFTFSIVPRLLPSDFFLRYLYIYDTEKTPTTFIENLLCKKMEQIFQTTKFFQVIDQIDDIFALFYSEFLNVYDAQTAKDMGVNYTPCAIVDFMVQGMDYFLEHEFDIKNGILHDVANYKTTSSLTHSLNLRIIEPAAGTMAFPLGLLNLAYSKLIQLLPLIQFETDNISVDRIYQKWIEDFFFRHLYAFEILPIPYIFGKINVYLNIFDRLIQDTNPKCISADIIEKKLHYFLTNSITDPSLFNKLIENEPKYPIGKRLSEEKPPLLVIFGNPPYNINTQNDSDWLRSLLEDYKIDLNEKNLKILSDDYVKFIRVSQWEIGQNGKGMIIFITNNNYLDGSLFRIMRKSMLESFNKIYIADLHGNMRKDEKANPFNIKVGVAIMFAIRTSNDIGPNKCSIHYLDVNGETVEEKYQILNQSFTSEMFQSIPITPEYFFLPKNSAEEERYHEFICIKDLFLNEPKSGIMSGRDSLVSNVDPELLKQNIDLFFKHDFDFLDKLGVEVGKTKNWDPETAFKRSNKEKALKNIVKYNYRGFDVRYLVYDPALVEGSRIGYINLISKANPAISTTRSIRAQYFSHALITRYPPEKCHLAVKDSSYVFLLKYDNNGTEYNLNLTKVSFPTTPEDLFYYIYSILSCNLYRQRYQTQLKRNFARIPFPKSLDPKLTPSEFVEMTQLGKLIANIHMGIDFNLQQGEFGIADCSDKRIINPVYLPSHALLLFNYLASSPKSIESSKISSDEVERLKKNGMWVSGITNEMWEFEIGSIPQIQNWLISRKYVDPIKEVHDYQKDKTPRKRHVGLRRGLNSEDLQDFMELCVKIKRTIQLLPELDACYAKIDRIIQN
jgi:hypothetical protein